MNKYVRDRLLIPIGIPIAVLVGMGFIIVNISRIFLTLTANGAVVVGTILSIAILFGCAYAASPRHRKRSRVGVTMLIILGLGAGIAGAWAADRGERKIEKHEPVNGHTPEATPSPTPGEADVVVEIVAKGIKFDKTTLSLPAGKTVDVHLRNDDAAIHNWSMYRDENLSDAVFRGDTFSGPNTDKHNIFTAPGAGTYYFKCDVHPDMRGTVQVT